MRMMRNVAVVLLVAAIAVTISNKPSISQMMGATNLGPIVNGPDSDFGPIITADGNALYFTSDRPGGFGGQDIYVSRRSTEGWSTPVNLGKNINTRFNEGPDTLSIDEKTLYFTRCDQVRDPGTCDIYFAGYDEAKSQWGRSRNLGRPINSEYNDANASLSHDQDTLYFVSERPETKGGRIQWDIFRARKNSMGAWGTPERLGLPVNSTEQEFHVMIHPNNQLLFFSSNGHGGFGGSDIFVSAVQGESFGPPRNLGPIINSPDNDMYFTLAAAFDIAYFASNRGVGFGLEDIYMVPFDIEFLDTGIVLLQGIVLDRCTCKTGPAKDPATGDYIYNPADGCKPIENARVQITATSTQSLWQEKMTGPGGEFEAQLSTGDVYVVSASAPKYSYQTKRIALEQDHPSDIIPVYFFLDTCDVYVTDNVYFDPNSSKLRCDAEEDLARAIRWLHLNPGTQLELAGHASCEGTLAHNIKLSRSRARAVKDYMVEVGSIDPNRIEFHGYGENMPITTNCSEDGREVNRRVEFKIIP